MGTILLLVLVLLGGAGVYWLVRRASSDPLAGQVLSITSYDVASDNPSFEVGGLRFVEVFRSPNGRFLTGRTEPEARGKTIVAVAEARTGRVLFSVRVALANHPMVTNDGTLIVEDMIAEDSPRSVLLAFRHRQKVWQARFDARIYTTGLSEDSKQVFVCTRKSPVPSHSEKTFIYEVRTGRLLRHFSGIDDAALHGKFPGSA